MSDNQNLDNIVDDNTDDDDNEDQLQMDDEEDEIPFDHDDFNKAEPSHQEPQQNKRTHGETSGSIFQAKRNKKQIDEDILRNMEQRIAQLERSTQRLTNAILDRERDQPQQNAPNRDNRDGNRNDVSPPPANRQPQVNSVMGTTGHLNVHNIQPFLRDVNNAAIEIGANVAYEKQIIW
ncbi:hypothetical protein OSTOST_23955 [Ostertagia ostertagi]